MRIQLDALLSQLGNPGRYQLCIFFLLCLNYFPLVFNHVVMAFFGTRYKHQCYSSQYGVPENDSLLHLSVTGPRSDQVMSVEVGSCETIYSLQGSLNTSVTCPDHPDSLLTYGTMNGEENIVTQWDLVCSRTYLVSLATTIYFCGVMVGGILFGHLADKFGRKPIMLITLYMPILVGIATAFAPWYSLFVALRFVQGVFMQGLQTTTYVLAMELFLPQHRSYAGAILECFWGMAVMVMPFLAYMISNWRYLQIVICVPSVLSAFYVCVVPESLRWLIMTGRVDAAEVQVNRMSRWNKAGFPTLTWERIKQQLGTTDRDRKKYSFVDTLRTPQLRKRSIILFYIWFSISVGYYGLTWMLTGLPGNKYLNFFIAGAVEFVAYTLVIYITKRFGRKRPLLAYFSMASVCMVGAGIALAYLPHQVYLSSGLAVAGKFAMGGLFSVIFLYTSELYPTIIRNIGMGSCAFWTRVGGVVAPQILFLNEFGTKALPLILFGVTTALGGILTLLLPETLGSKLPDSISDVEQLGSHDSLEMEPKEEGEETEKMQEMVALNTGEQANV